jgi:hypothetical protein
MGSYEGHHLLLMGLNIYIVMDPSTAESVQPQKSRYSAWIIESIAQRIVPAGGSTEKCFNTSFWAG